MPPSDVTRAADDLQLGLQPIMGERAFRRRGRTFSRLTSDGLTQIVQLQVGTADPPGTTYIPGLRENLYGAVTVNLGVFIPEVARINGNLPKLVREHHCCIRARLGALGPEHRDLWWELMSNPTLTRELAQRLMRDGLPWLDGLLHRDAVLEMFEESPRRGWDATPSRIICALIRLQRGEHEKARALLADQFREALTSFPHHAEYVQELAGKLGLGALAA